MRNAFMRSMFDLAKNDKDVMILTADLGFSVFESFEEQFPNQFINVGVAEQNMIGIASGLALEGKKVFVYSIGNFPTLRCLEQIRNDACYHDLNINVVAMGGGFSYGSLGMSHHATEDISVMRSLPNVVVVVPTTEKEAETATKKICYSKGVGYLRLDKTSATSSMEDNFAIGGSQILFDGRDYTVFAIGGVAQVAMEAAQVLTNENVSLKVVSLASVKPIDEATVLQEVQSKKGILVLEEGTSVNGLASAIADICLDAGVSPKKFQRYGIDDTYVSVVGDQGYLREYCGLTAENICNTVRMWEQK